MVGVDYYLEQWERGEWERDADMMRQAGVRVVRLAEFAWCRMQPREQLFDLDWLEEGVGIFAERGISVILCTPTNCPPLWVYEKYPDTLQTERSGRKTATGIRGHRCLNSKTLRKLSAKIIRLMAERFADNPAVIAWQIDNELDAAQCCCEECTDKFRAFLKKKYHTLEAVNDAYGNIVWSGEYSSWEQVKPPLGDYNEGWYNPGFMLDWKRFCMGNVNDFVRFQTRLLREICPDVKITTNTWLCENTPDYYEMFRELDFVSFDNYPPSVIPDDENAVYSHAFHLDLMRGFKDGKPFCIMEQLSGSMGCWMPIQPSPQPGMIKGYSLQAAAHGADMILHFRWRSARKGAEMFWHGILDHSGVPNRRYREFEKLCHELNELEPLIKDTRINNKCAILFSIDSLCALNMQAQADGFHYFNQLKGYHDALTSLGVGCDFVDERSDFSHYKLLVVPSLYIAKQDVVKRIYDFAENGGTVVLTDRCGVKGENNECLEGRLPCAFAQMAGCEVKEYTPIGYGSVGVKMHGKEYTANTWCDILKLKTAERLCKYTDRYFSGSAAAAVNSFGKGTVYYIGFCADRPLYIALMKDVLKTAKIKYIDGLPKGAEITVREKEGVRLTFIFNNTDKPMTVSAGSIECVLAPFEMKIT